ncbi:hypothetical protein GCM10027271_38540 [Saccharopolyspora gloriosae]
MRAADLTSRTPFCPSAMPLITHSPATGKPPATTPFPQSNTVHIGGARSPRRALRAAGAGRTGPGPPRNPQPGAGSTCRVRPISVARPAASSDAIDSP